MKKIVKGNDFTLRIPVSKKVNGGIVPFPLTGCTDIKVQLVGSFSILTLAYTLDIEHDNVIIAEVKGDRVKKDIYSLVVSGRKFGNAWQSKEYEQIAIVEYNKDGDTEFETTDEGDNSVEMDTSLVIRGIRATHLAGERTCEYSPESGGHSERGFEERQDRPVGCRKCQR